MRDLPKEDLKNILGNYYHYNKYINKDIKAAQKYLRMFDEVVCDLNDIALKNKYEYGHNWINSDNKLYPFRFRHIKIEQDSNYRSLVERILKEDISSSEYLEIKKSLKERDLSFRCPTNSVECYLKELRVRLELLGKPKEVIELYLKSTVGVK